jgi:hypothetical protein
MSHKEIGRADFMDAPMPPATTEQRQNRVSESGPKCQNRSGGINGLVWSGQLDSNQRPAVPKIDLACFPQMTANSFSFFSQEKSFG